MAYDRFDPRYDRPRNRWADDDQPRWRGQRDPQQFSRGRDDDRGFFERAGDEIASWFGDDDAERRRERDRFDEARGQRGWYGQMRDEDDRYAYRGRDPAERSYRPLTGDYGRSERTADRGASQRDFGRVRDDRGNDPHYRSWRDRQMAELDRDYDEYRRENQSRFESEFGNWRQQRMQKRSMLGSVREHMDVVGSDDEHVGTVDRVAGDRIILTKSDPDSGGVHHSISCGNIERVEDNRVILDCTAEQAKTLWRDDSRSRALFEREDQGEVGPHILDRSFAGTYR